MSKVSLLDLPITTFTPDQEGQPHLAFIDRPGRLPIYFRGKTSMQAHMKAVSWREEEAAKGNLKTPEELAG
ncbi:hypothetical protein [Salipiger marinus]|jgi:hypothetical protein|uniref:Uncharacterized protein n=1 Tax=Salipiger marinus TaxID=555512 RepID=A0A1G8MPV3_9RHOB|nr:hypothetical protein [Salipiger marinus]SDI70001.1 hypothetical protein SAMN04487993_1008196 [Salipiger marinus]